MKIEVGKKYELNNGEVHECTMMRDDDHLAVDDHGYGPFIVGNCRYHQDGRFADCDADYELSVKREVITIEPGKYYLTRDGRKVGPMEECDCGDGYPFTEEEICGWWNSDGKRQANKPETDIIAKWTEDDELNAICDERKDGPFTRDPELTSPYGDGNHPLPPMVPETGTLAELQVKPGDVVECVVSAFGNTNFIEGNRYVASDKGVITDEIGNKYLNGNPDSMSKFRIISRASDTPKTWGEMTDAEKGAMLLACHEGNVIEVLVNDLGVYKWQGRASDDWHDHMKYRIKPQPQRETVSMEGANYGQEWEFDEHKDEGATHRITFTTTDGKPATGVFRNDNGDVIKMEEV